MKTRSAICASEIKKELKVAFKNVKFSVRSDNFAGGNSVDITWTDGPTTEKVKNIVGKRQYGHFDGMIDLYELSNVRKDITQAKYVMPKREISFAFACKLAEIIKENRGVEIEIKHTNYGYEVVNDQWSDIYLCWTSQLIYRESVNVEFYN
jgi:hypothetical protein